jgi:hypothetical protein
VSDTRLGGEPLLRIGGDAVAVQQLADEEIAVLVLMLLAAGRDAEQVPAGAHSRRRYARWHDGRVAFRAPHSWQVRG